jgi:polyisoprenoid-binding protein YceI
MKQLLITALIAAAGAAQAAPATYAIDPTHTFVSFEISHFGTSTNRGRFDKKEGTVPFDKHLQSPELLDAAKFPTAKFVADKFSFNGDKVSEISGTLTMLGKTNPITLKALNFNCYDSPMLKREVCGGDFESTITRSQYGVSYGLNWGFPDNVKLIIQVEAVKQ